MIEDSNKQNEKGKKRNNNNRCHRNTGKKKPTRIEYYEQICSNKLNNLEEINKLLETYCPPKISQDETDSLNRPIIMCEVESVFF